MGDSLYDENTIKFYYADKCLALTEGGEDYIEDICKMPIKNMLKASKFGKISPKNIKTSPMDCPLAKHNSTR